MQLYDGEKLHAVATHAVSDKFAEILRDGYRAADSPASRALIEGSAHCQIADSAEIDHPVFRNAAELSGIRTVLFVPLRRDDAFLGLISAARQEVRLFTDKQIALLQNFAAQAVIAMENARLLTETREALEQQTATAEVLQVINSSPGDLGPVFDAMLERATNLCESGHGALFIRDGESDYFHAIPSHSTPKAFAEFLTRKPIYFDPERSILAQTLRQRSAIQVADMRLSEPYRYKFPLALAAVEAGGTRTLLSVPLFRDDVPVGIFQLARQDVRPFSDTQIALVSNFAASRRQLLGDPCLHFQIGVQLAGQQRQPVIIARLEGVQPTAGQPAINCLKIFDNASPRLGHEPAQLLLGLKRTQADCIAVALRDVFGNVVAQGVVADPELLGRRLYASAGTHKKIKAAALGMEADAALDLLVRSRPPAPQHAFTSRTISW